MPVSSTLADGLTATVTEHYAEAERVLLVRMAKSLAKGIDNPGWAQAKLIEVHSIQSRAKTLLAQLGGDAEKAITEALNTAALRGAAAADADLVGALTKALNPITSSMPGSRAVVRLAAETTDKVLGTHPRILRSTVDAYRSVVAQASGQVLLGTQTRLEATQAALDSFAKRGITGLVDRAGRGWDMESYTEMAVRTSTAHAAVAAHMDRLQEAGQDLVIVSNAPAECSRCRPWEGKVLSISGSAVGTEAVASLDEATSAGLFHPNCRHSTGIYLPGITKPMMDTEDPQGDADRQKLRYLERQVQAEKRVQAVALDPAAARKAELRIRARQAQIREHVRTTKVAPIGAPVAPVAKIPDYGFTSEYNGVPLNKVVDEAAAMSDAGRVDRGLGAVFKKNGFNGLPTLVDQSGFDSAVADGGKVMYRGIEASNPHSNLDALKYVNDFKNGDLFVGQGLAGNGTYAATNLEVATKYAANVKENIISMVLPKEAKIISREELEAIGTKMRKELYSAHENFAFREFRGEISAATDFINDPGRLATSLGYDAILVPDAQGLRRGFAAGVTEDDYYVILNRSILKVLK